MRRLILILFRPPLGTEALREKPQWLAQFLVLSLISIAVTVFISPYLVNATLDHLPHSATPHDKIVVMQTLEQELVARCAFLPVRLLIGWVSFAFVLFYICKGFNTREPVRLVHIFSLEVFAETVLVLAQVATAIKLSIMNVHDSSSAMTVPFGVNDIIRTSNDYILLTLFNSLNIFSIWYLAILTAGVCAFYKFQKVKGFISVFAAWGISVLFKISVMYFLRDTFHFKL